jgi:hypothetical protein
MDQQPGADESCLGLSPELLEMLRQDASLPGWA